MTELPVPKHPLWHPLSLRMLLLAVVLAVLAACGSDFAVPGPAPLPQLATDVVQIPGDGAPKPTPTCLADSDCAGLALAGCAAAVCEPTTRRCVVRSQLDGALCQDGNPCTTEDRCQGGLCTAGYATVCEDGNPCTQDACKPAEGCVFPFKTLAACTDGNPCTTGDRCVQGACVADANVCQCNSDNDCAGLSDDSCAGALLCSQGQCVTSPGLAKICDDTNTCTVDSCDPATGACVFTPLSDGASCADGDACTAQDRCVQGECGGVAVLCSDPSGCGTSCDPTLGCIGSGAGGCDDGNPCTSLDQCTGAGCVGAPTAVTTTDNPEDICGCQTAADCTAPLATCLGGWQCVAGLCQVDPALAVACPAPAGDSCEVAVCNATGCSLQPAPNGATCNDGNKCTLGDVCSSGNCKSGLQIGCDDGLDCTVDACTPAQGCIHGPGSNGKPCNDGNPCTKNELCDTLACVGGTPTCDDGNPCTLDLCNPAKPGGCLTLPLAEGADCDDGNDCSQGGQCASGQCVSAFFLDCNDGSPCTIDSCGVDGCETLPVAASTTCDDGDVCTGDDSCQNGVCQGVAGLCGGCSNNADCVDEDDGDPCTGVLVCKSGTCQLDPTSIPDCPTADGPCLAVGCQPGTGLCVVTALPAGGVCTDGNVCTVGDVCGSAGFCVPGVPLTDCSDNNPCDFEQCDPAKGCVSELVDGAACDDGDLCTGLDSCLSGSCQPGLFVCQCLTDSDCAGLDDGNACNGQMLCNQGACVESGTPVVCPPGQTACTITACDPVSGGCVAFAGPDGTDCGTTGLCTSGGVCASGQCVGAQVVSCEDGNVCTTNACDGASGDCTSAPATGPCGDGGPCAPGTCSGGACVSAPLVCNDLKACTTDTCNNALGGCSFALPTAANEDFEAPTPPGFSFTVLSGSNSWQTDLAQARTGARSLYCGQLAGDGQHFYGPGTAQASVSYGVPAGVTTATVSMWVWTDRDPTETETVCSALPEDTDGLRIITSTTAGQNITEVCERTTDWKQVTIVVPVQPGDFLGVGLVWVADAAANAGQGVWVDDLQVSWDCPPAP